MKGSHDAVVDIHLLYLPSRSLFSFLSSSSLHITSFALQQLFTQAPRYQTSLELLTCFLHTPLSPSRSTKVSHRRSSLVKMHFSTSTIIVFATFSLANALAVQHNALQPASRDAPLTTVTGKFCHSLYTQTLMSLVSYFQRPVIDPSTSY